MSTSLIDLLMKPVKPWPMPEFAPPPRELAPGLWRIERKLRMPGALVLPVGMTVTRLPSGALFLHAPILLDDDVARALGALGPVAAVLAPNSFHYSFVAAYRSRFPSAELFAAPGLAERVPELPPATVVGASAPPEWEGELEPLLYGPIGSFSEVAVYHRPTGTLVLTDLAFHMTRFENALDRLGWKLLGVPPDFGPSRTARLTLLRDRAAARPFLQAMLERDVRRILVAHGDPVEANAAAEFRRAFRAYLEP